MSECVKMINQFNFMCVIRAGSQRSRLKHVMSHIKGTKIEDINKTWECFSENNGLDLSCKMEIVANPFIIFLCNIGNSDL